MKRTFFISLICFTLSFIGYLITSKTALFDSIMLKIIRLLFDNKIDLLFLGETSASLTLSEYIADILASNGLAAYYGNNAIIKTLLTECRGYVLGLIQLIYNLIFVTFWLIFNFILKILVKIFMGIFFSLRKHKKKMNRNFANGNEYMTYHKEPRKGGLIGLTKAFLSSIITFTIIGSSLYTISGKGDDYLTDLDFGNETINCFYNCYQSIESYGSQGIFKVLNSVTDENDFPIYLYLTDIVFSFDVEEDGTIKKYNLVNETGESMDMVIDLANLAQQYFANEIVGFANGSMSSDAVINKLMTAYNDENFINSVTDIVDSINDDAFAYQLGMSAVDVLAAEIDNLGLGLDPNVSEMVKICFDSTYLSSKIPDERELISKLNSNIITTTSNIEYRPTIKASQIIQTSDVNVLIRGFVKYLKNYGLALPTIDLNDLTAVLPIANIAIETIQNLSLFKTEPESFNGLLSRLYVYLENVYFTDGQYNGLKYSDIKNRDINWIGEIKSLMNIIPEATSLYTLYKESNGDIKSVVHSIFDKNNENYATYNTSYKKIMEIINTSKLLNEALNLPFVQNIIKGILPTIYLPDSLQYTTVKYSSGTIKTYGELTYILSLIDLIASNNVDTLDNIIDMFNTGDQGSVEETSDEEPSILDSIQPYIDLLNSILTIQETSNGLTAKQCLCDSFIIRSFLTASLDTFLADNQFIYISEQAKEKNGEKNTVNVIKKEEFTYLINNLNNLLDLLPAIMNASNNFGQLLEDEDVMDTLKTLINDKSPLIEGILGKTFVSILGSMDMISMPEAYKTNIEKWVSNDYSDGETYKLLSVLLDEEFKPLLQYFLGGDQQDSDDDQQDVAQKLEQDDSTLNLLGTILDICGDEENADKLLNSEVLYYTISSFLTANSSLSFGGFSIIMPDSSKTTIDSVTLVKKGQIKSLFVTLSELGLDFSDTNGLIASAIDAREDIKNSNILTATFANFIVSNKTDFGFDSLPSKLESDGTEEKLQQLSSTNSWKSEVYNLLSALKELFNEDLDAYKLNEDPNYENDISREEYDELSDTEKEGYTYRFSVANIGNVKNKIFSFIDSSVIKPSASKLSVIYESLMVKDMVSKEIDNIVDEEMYPEDNKEKDSYNRIQKAKSNGYYKESEVTALIKSLIYFFYDDIEFDKYNYELDISDPEDLLSSKISKLTDIDPDYSEEINETNVIPLNQFAKSTILWNVLNDYLDESLSKICSQDKLNSIKTNGTYAIEDISATLNLINKDLELDINELGDDSIDKFKDMSLVNLAFKFYDKENNKTINKIAYIIISEMLIDEGIIDKMGLSLPKCAMNNDLIKASDMYDLLIAAQLIVDGDSQVNKTIADVESGEDISLSTNSITEKLLGSVIIRYTFTQILIDNKGDNILYVMKNNEGSSYEIKDNQLILSDDELLVLKNLFTEGGDGGINLDNLGSITKERYTAYIQSDIIRILLSDQIMKDYEKVEQYLDNVALQLVLQTYYPEKNFEKLTPDDTVNAERYELIDSDNKNYQDSNINLKILKESGLDKALQYAELISICEQYLSAS